jgi:hypothetical protein
MILHTHDLQPLTDEILQTGYELGYYEPGNVIHWLFASEQAHLQVDELHEFARQWDAAAADERAVVLSAASSEEQLRRYSTATAYERYLIDCEND